MKGNQYMAGAQWGGQFAAALELINERWRGVSAYTSAEAFENILYNLKKDIKKLETARSMVEFTFHERDNELLDL